MTKEDLEKKVKNFFGGNFSLKSLSSAPKEILENFNFLVGEIEDFNLSKEERDLFLSNLIGATALLVSPPKDGKSLLGFFEEIAQVRLRNCNIIEEKFRKKLVEVVKQVDLEDLSSDEKINFVKNLDFIGLEFPKMENADNFLRECLQNFDRVTYKKSRWTRNLAHFLAHCKNIGLLAPEKLELKNREALQSLIGSVTRYVSANEADLGFLASDAGAALDVLLYCENVLGIKTCNHEKAVLAKVARVDQVIISTAQRSAFKKITKFLESSSAKEGEWHHVADGSRENIFIYGGKISLELEGALISAEGVVLRSGDIVIRNLDNGKILRVVEVDGPSHFISPLCKTPRTAARDAFIKALVGADNFEVINLDSSGIFKFSTAEITSTAESKIEINFLFGVRDFIQAEFVKDELAAAAVAQNVAETKIVSKAAEAPNPAVEVELEPVVPQRSKVDIKEIEEELVQDFVLMLKEGDAQELEAILSDPRFVSIKSHRISQQLSGAEPFDFVLEKFNENPQENFLLTLQILWINGFEIKRKELVKAEIEYPQELRCALGLAKVEAKKEQPTDLRFLLQKVHEGGFLVAANLIKKRGLPDKLDEKDKRIILLILQTSLQNLDRSIFYAVKSQPWIGVIEEELFVAALRAGDDVTVSFFLKNKKDNSDFFIKLFRSDDFLVKNIANLKTDKIADSLKEIIGKDAELAFKAYDVFGNAVRGARAGKIVSDLIEKASRKGASAEEIYLVGRYFLHGIGTKLDRKSACEFFEKAAALGYKDAEIHLVETYDAMGRKPKAIELCEELMRKYPNDGKFQHKRAGLEKDKEKGQPFLLKAAHLGYPESLGLVAVEYFFGLFGLPVDKDKAIEMATKAVALGDEESISNLGIFYLERDSKRNPMNDRMAFYFFNQSFVKNNGIGAANVASCYENGYGVAKDKAKALACYQQALKFGIGDSATLSSVKERIRILSEKDLVVDAKPSGSRIAGASAESPSAAAAKLDQQRSS